MASFEVFFPQLLKFEGGFSNDPQDTGGPTNKGITMKTFAECAKQLLNVEPTLDNLKVLTDQQAAQIYKVRYWERIGGNEIELQELANIVFDFQVNSGSHASKLLQTILNDLGANPPLQVDGAIGPGTMNALKAADQKAVYRLYKPGRVAYYRQLVLAHPEKGKFLNGWLNRVQTFPDL